MAELEAPESEPVLAPHATPADFGVGATFGCTVLALAPYALMAAYFDFPSAGWPMVISTAGIPIAVLVLGYAVRRSGLNFVDYVAIRRPHARAILIGIICQLALSAVRLLFHGTTHAHLVARAELAESVLWWFSVFAIVIVTPIGEEIVFRGFMYSGLARRMEPVFAISLISLIFAALHFDDLMMWQFTCGYLWGVLRWRTESIWAPISAHMTANLLSLTFTYVIHIS